MKREASDVGSLWRGRRPNEANGFCGLDSTPRAVDPKGAKTDGVGGDAGVTHPSDQALRRQGPLPLNVEMAVNAGGHSGVLEFLDGGAGALVLVERRIVPEDVERHSRLSEGRGRFEGAIQRYEFLGGFVALLGGRFIGKNLTPLGSADDRPSGFDSVPSDRQLGFSQEGADLVDIVPPDVVVPAPEDLRSRQSIEPGEVGLEVAVVSRHRDVARDQNEVAGFDDGAPFLLDLGGVIPPAFGVTLPPLGVGKREM